MFSGMSSHSIDSKGRIVLPAKFRDELGESFFVTRGFGNGCIQAMSREVFKDLTAKIKDMPADMSMALQYLITANATEVTPNAQGRIILPQMLREYAEIENEAIVMGMDDRVEIWNKKRYDEYMLSRRDIFDSAMHLLRF